jgi:hypothetical protein
MTAFYARTGGALETQEFRTAPIPFLAPLLFGHDQGIDAANIFVVLLPDGTFVSMQINVQN